MVIADARVRDEQIELARPRDRALDRAAISDVHLHPLAADLLRDRRDLLAAARADNDVPAVARERPRDARAVHAGEITAQDNHLLGGHVELGRGFEAVVGDIDCHALISQPFDDGVGDQP